MTKHYCDVCGKLLKEAEIGWYPIHWIDATITSHKVELCHECHKHITPKLEKMLAKKT